MRTEVVERIQEERVTTGEAIEDSAVKLARQNFQSAFRSEDSLVDSQEIGMGPVVTVGGGHTTCTGDFLLTFRDEALRRNRGSYFQLIQKLIELLKDAGSPDAQRASLCLFSEGEGETRRAAGGLKIRLEASGDTREQAALRWGLGLAHLQQALLFTSRYLRQQISRKGE